MLLLMRQDWRTSINRFAEAMTLFAVACAGFSRCCTSGRIWKFYYLFPYPNTMLLWPQFRSPLVWDVFAVSTYATVSLLFWYVGLDPRPRDAARPRQQSLSSRSSTAFSPWAGAALPGTGSAIRPPTCCWAGWRRRW